MNTFQTLAAIVKNGSNLTLNEPIETGDLESILAEAGGNGGTVTFNFSLSPELMKLWSEIYGKHVAFVFPPSK